MSISTSLVTIDGERVASALDMSGASKDFVRHASPGTSVLRFIDPYGYTMFNRLQCLELHDEWTSAAEQFLDATDAQNWAAEVAALIRRCGDEYGFFVRFVGE